MMKKRYRGLYIPYKRFSLPEQKEYESGGVVPQTETIESWPYAYAKFPDGGEFESEDLYEKTNGFRNMLK